MLRCANKLFYVKRSPKSLQSKYQFTFSIMFLFFELLDIHGYKIKFDLFLFLQIFLKLFS